MATRHEARQAVKDIARKYGVLDEDVLKQMEPDVRRQVEEAFLAKDQLVAHSIKTFVLTSLRRMRSTYANMKRLATQLYGSEARFVFELLQNADDNSFQRVFDLGQAPSVSFTVHPDRIVVECNEDGFTVENLNAICAVNKSTKSTSHGYIGTKGIGFKSVFMAAWKVQIQSGHFSFAFKHNIGDSGLGMVIPKWEDRPEVLDSPLTRMTLYLHDEDQATESSHRRRTILSQLNELQHTCLLFLRNLKRIEITFQDANGARTSSRLFRMKTVGNHKCYMKTSTTVSNGKKQTQTALYHLTKETFFDAPSSDSRRNITTGESAAGASTCDVVLAFPVTADHEPVIARQDIFAFLPVRDSSFNVRNMQLCNHERSISSNDSVLTMGIPYSSSYNQTLTQVQTDKTS